MGEIKMSGPWEKYSSSDTVESSGPWSTYRDPPAKQSNIPKALAKGFEKSSPFGFMDIIERWAATQGKDIPDNLSGAERAMYVPPAEPEYVPETTGEKVAAGAAEIAPEILQAIGTGGAAGALKGTALTKFLLQALGGAAPGAARGAARGFEEGGAGRAIEKGGESALTDLLMSSGALGAGKLAKPFINKAQDATQFSLEALQESRLPKGTITEMSQNIPTRITKENIGGFDAANLVDNLKSTGDFNKLPLKTKNLLEMWTDEKYSSPKARQILSEYTKNVWLKQNKELLKEKSMQSVKDWLMKMGIGAGIGVAGSKLLGMDMNKGSSQ